MDFSVDASGDSRDGSGDFLGSLSEEHRQHVAACSDMIEQQISQLKSGKGMLTQ